jgi:mannose-6-phosphate isomerase-like protein (cupin superfamily)
MKRIILFALLMTSLAGLAWGQETKANGGGTTVNRADKTMEEGSLRLREGFGMWKLSDFKEHEKVLDSKIGPDHSARETLGNYGNHKIRFIHRVGTGAPEFHTYFVDLWIVESGHGTLVVGGTLVDPKPLTGNEAAARGDMTGTSIEGGERHDVSPGDVIHIPPKTPHQILVNQGEEITYLRIAIPSE